MHSLIFAKTINHLKSGRKTEAAITLGEISENELLPKGRELYLSLQRLLGDAQDRERLVAIERELNKELVGGISLVTACMNRNANLLRVLPTWLSLDVNEIIIVDWGSAEPLTVTLQDFDDSRVRIVRVENVDEWCLTLALNVGLRLASSEIVYKLDSDIGVTEDFIQQNTLGTGQFIRGNWKSAVDAGLPDQKYVNGSFGAFKSDLIEVGFYNENIRTYGWDDSDLYARLVANRITARFLSPTSITHLEHDMSERLVNQKVSRSSFLGQFPATEFHNIKNKYLCDSLPPWDGRGLQDFYAEEIDPKTLQLSMVGSLEVIPKALLNSAKVEALKEMLGWLGFAGRSALEACLKSKDVAERFIEHYEFGIPYDLSRDLLLGQGSIEPLWGPQHLCIEAHGALPCIYVSTNNDSRAVTFEYRERAWWILPSANGNAQQWPGAGIGDNEKLQNFTFFVTSVFDEQVEQRQQEYIKAISLNLSLFDFAVLFYEKESGLMREKLEALEFSFKILWIDVPTRPTFELMFETMNVLAPAALVTIANADVCFDDPLESLFQYPLDNTLIVVSRLDEVAAMRGEFDRIRLENGLPNTLSADAWIYKAPMLTRFKKDYAIGTFNCDSFMNFRGVDSGLTVINPCLDISLNHLHDPENNSSAEKEQTQAEAISEMVKIESDTISGGNPCRGIQWGRLSDLECLQDSFPREVIWTEFNIEVVVDTTERNLLQVCFLALKLVELRQLHGIENLSIWIGVSQSISAEVYRFLMTLQGEFGPNSFYINTASRCSATDVPETPQEVGYHILQSLTAGELAGGDSADAKAFMSALRPFLTRGKTDTFGYQKLRTNDRLVSGLISSLSSATLEKIERVVRDSIHFREAFDYFAADLRRVVKVRSQQFVVPTEPRTTLVASIFKSEKYMRGYLDNLACCLDSSNCRAILIDPASPENERAITEDFLEKNSWLGSKLQYVRLENDPGLYECWNQGIRMADTEFVGNANTDDKRSPYQITELVDLLDLQKNLAGAASALRVSQHSDHSWFDFEPGEVWFDWLDKRIYGCEDLFRIDDGLVKSTNFMHCLPIWRRELHHRFGFFDESKYGTSADWAFWLKCGLAGERFAFDNRPMGTYFLNAKSHNRVNDADGAKELSIIEDFVGVRQSAVLKQ